MDWQQWASVAEIAGAAGVIISVVYLAHQVQQTNRISRSSAVSDLQSKFIDLYAMIVSDPVTAELLAKLSDPDYEPESPAEAQRLENFAFLVASIWFSSQMSFDQGQMERGTFETYKDDVRARLAQWPALRPHLRRAISRYPSVMGLEILEPEFDDAESGPSIT